MTLPGGVRQMTGIIRKTFIAPDETSARDKIAAWKVENPKVAIVDEGKPTALNQGRAAERGKLKPLPKRVSITILYRQ